MVWLYNGLAQANCIIGINILSDRVSKDALRLGRYLLILRHRHLLAETDCVVGPVLYETKRLAGPHTYAEQ